MAARRNRSSTIMPAAQPQLARWTTSDLADNRQRAAAARRERAKMRRALEAREVTLSAVILESPEWARGQLIWDVLLLQLYFHEAKLHALNRRAVAAGVNLAGSLRRAPLTTRVWLARDLEARGR